ncbi:MULTISPECIES: type 4a pilus biogenesis protein PilO [unclassified Pseudomonas]|uniref:type 4a pilus biogenesis protein PilO n=1 Tax=unclassified Pseudomonas TaxID=196821 RepID=UPI003858F233
MMAHWLDSLRSVELQDLGLRQAGAWSPRHQALVAMAWVSVLLGLGYWLVLQGSMTRLEGQRGAEVAMKTEFEAKARALPALASYTLHVQALEEAYQAFMTLMPHQAEVPGLLDDISRMGLASGLQIEQMQWSAPVTHGLYIEQPLQLSLVGHYHEVGLFLSSLSSLPRLVTSHDFTLVPLNTSGDGRLRMSLLAKTYHTPTSGLAP